ncbi:MAG TPA: MaoC family dehydratase N-terminal domain-containing protein [Acidimicrobiales bacterium]|nr:MaoC family dehydratase N-terminal domain-containing protein [Acidimicrobiales bacterium]
MSSTDDTTTGTAPVPDDVTGWIGETRYAETADFPVERGYVWTSCASVENGNPLYWDDAVAAELTGGPIAPPSTLSLWFRPHHWQPGQTAQKLPLQVHFDLKDRLGLPEAIMSDSEVVFHEPVRPGDVISTAQVLRSLSEPKTTKLGSGRFWVIDVPYRNQRDELVGVETFTGFGYVRAAQPVSSDGPAPAATAAGTGAPSETVSVGPSEGGPPAGDGSAAETGAPGHVLLGDVAVGDPLPDLAYEVTATTVVLGALATRDWRPMHHDRDFAIHRNGARDIFLNTPNQQAWFERFVTDWTGPQGRPGRLHFRMRDSVYPGDTMTLTGTVAAVETDATGCGWATVAIEVRAGGPTEDVGRLCTTATLRIAVPTVPDDNPWQRRGDQWTP